MTPNARRILDNIIGSIQEADEMSGIDNLDEYIRVMEDVAKDVSARIANASALRDHENDPQAPQTEEDPYFWLQVKARAGNWVDDIGSQSLDTILSMKEYREENGGTCRIVTKTLNIINPGE